MSLYDDELKDLFREKHRENDFAPDEENWRKMAAVLNRERKARRLVYFGLLLIGLGLAGAWLLAGPDQGDREQPVLAAGPPSSEAGQESIPGATDKAPVWGSDPADGRAPENRGGHDPEGPSPHTALPSGQTAQTERGQPEKKDPVSGQLLAGDSQAPVHQKGSGRSASLDPGFPVGKDTKTKMVLEPEEQETVPVSPGMEERVAGIKDVKISPLQPTGEAEAFPSGQDSLPERLAAIAIEVLADTGGTPAVAEEILSPQPAKADSLLAVSLLPDSLLPQALIAHRLSLELGVDGLTGWTTADRREGRGINPLAGLRYDHQVSERFGLSAGVYYSRLGHMGQTTHISTRTRLKFGEETEVTEISALQIHYLLLPLKLNYSLSRRDVLSVGYTLAYLLDVDSRVEQYTTRLNDPGTRVVSREKGYSSGFSPYDGQIALGYRRNLYSIWYVSGEFFYGLRDLKNNEVYATDAFERIYGLRLSLGINLWKK